MNPSTLATPLAEGQTSKHSSRRAARTAGMLFLVSYVGFSVGTALLAPTVDPSHDLATIYPDRTQVVVGVLFEYVNVAAIVGFAVLLYPYLKRHGEGLALGYVACRILEGAAYVVAMVSTLSLITLSKEAAAAGAPDAPAYEVARSVALGEGYWATQMATVGFVLGAVVLYSLLYRSQLVPRFISVWGLIAIVLLVAANIVVPDVSKGFEPAALLYVPVVVNELFLAGWLIVKGLSSSAVGPRVDGAEPATPHG